MTTAPKRSEALNLTYGKHTSREDGMCLMEAVAFLAGEGHSDQPVCACPVIAAYGRALNDRMGEGRKGDTLRAEYLAPLASRLVGTRSTPEVERRRVYLFADRAVRLFAPSTLESAGLADEAASLRALPEIVDEKTARTAADVSSCTANAANAAAAAAVANANAAAYYAASAARAANAARAASAAARAAANAEAWGQAVKVLAKACEITEGGS